MEYDLYWLMNDGTVVHEDYVDEYIVENDDSTWKNKLYKVDYSLLPQELKDDGSLVEDILMDYHKGTLPRFFVFNNMYFIIKYHKFIVYIYFIFYILIC